MSLVPAARRGMRVVRRATLCGVLAAMLAGALASPVSAAPAPLTIDVVIGGGEISGQVRDNAYVQVAVRDAAGKLIERGLASVGDGNWSYLLYGTGIYSGYTIKVVAFNTHGTLESRKVTVPPLTLSINRATDVISGKGPAGSQILVQLADYRWDFWGESFDEVRDIAVDGTGLYAHDFGADGINIRGGTQAAASWENAAGNFHVVRYGAAPELMLANGDADFAGVTRPNKGVKVTLRDGAANVLSVGSAVGDAFSGQYFGMFADADGDPYVVQGGEWLKAPSIGPDVQWQVPTIGLSVSNSTDQVSATCFANGRYEIYAFDPADYTQALAYGEADSAGALTQDLTSMINLRSRSYVAIACLTAEGDVVLAEHGSSPTSFSGTTALFGR